MSNQIKEDLQEVIILTALCKELKLQWDAYGPSAPYVDLDQEDSAVLDGEFDLKKVASAINQALSTRDKDDT